MSVLGSRVLPAYIFEHLGATLEKINLGVIATPPYNKSIGQWNLELEYQVWNSSSLPKPITSEWKRLTKFDLTSVVVEKGGCYSSIQAAVEGANPGSVIFVSPDHYVEDIFISKPLRLLAGKNGPKTTIFGQILIESSNVTIDGFVFHTLNSFKPSLVVINSSSVSILNCEFRSNKELKFLMQIGHHPHTSALLLQTSQNLQIMNSLFKDCRAGLTIDNCTLCNVAGNTFHSCTAAMQTFSSDSIRVTRNYFVRNFVALGVDSFEVVKHLMNENIFEKNSVMIQNGTSFSTTELQLAVNHSVTDKQSFSFKGPQMPSKVLIYGHSEEDHHLQSPNPTFVHIMGEFFLLHTIIVVGVSVHVMYIMYTIVTEIRVPFSD